MCEAVRAVNRKIKHFAVFAAIVVFGGGSLAATLAFAVPATRALTFGTTSNGAITPVLQALEQRSVIVDRNGRTMATLYATEDRAPVTLKDVSPGVIDAVVSIEDRTFYSHRGVDPKSILRALFKDVHSGVVAQGGSTITQQLVKNTLIDNPKRDLQRKVREAVLAMRLEEIYTKDEILERYLNTVYFGRDAYGIRAASERYFNEQPIELTIPQAAMLAGMISAPSAYDPILHPVAAKRRRHEVLLAMSETGIIDHEAVAAYDTYPLPKRSYNIATIAPTSYFVAEVVQRLLADKRMGADLPARRNLLYHGGLKHHDDLRPRPAGAGRERGEDDHRRCREAEGRDDPGHRCVGRDRQLEWRGAGHGEWQRRLERAGIQEPTVQLRNRFEPPGRLGVQGVHAGHRARERLRARDTIEGSRCTIPAGLTTDGKPYSPGGETTGVITLRTAITDSINCAFVRLLVALGGDPRNLNAEGLERAEAGPRKIIDVAHEMGVTNPNLKPYTSMTLGTEGVSPLDMASAYSTLANDGVHRPPIFVTKVEGPDKKVVFEEPLKGHQPTQVMPANVARTETDMLFGPVRSGTAARTLRDFPRPAAGKTGTTDNNVDAWFVGYTPQLTTAVWMGNPAGEISMNPYFGQEVFGGTIPARIWRAFMEPAHFGLPPVDFTPPDPTFWPSSRYISLTGRATQAAAAAADDHDDPDDHHDQAEEEAEADDHDDKIRTGDDADDPSWRTMTRPDLAALLRVQERDTGLDRLRYRRSAIPEREAIRERRAREAQLVVQSEGLRRDRDAALVEERRLDDEAQTLARRAKEVDGKLYSGKVSSPRELLDMQADIDQLDRHRSVIEEQELEVMERREALDTGLAALETELSGLRAELGELEATLGAERGGDRRRDRGRGSGARKKRPPSGRSSSPTSNAADRRITVRASRCSSGARVRDAGFRFPRPRSTGCAKTRRPVSRRATTAVPSSCRPVERTADRVVLLWYAAGSVFAVWNVFQSAGLDFRAVAVGSLLPLVIDIPAGHQAFGHALVAPVGALLLVMLLHERSRSTAASPTGHRPADRLVLRTRALGRVRARSGCSGGRRSAGASVTSRSSRPCPSSWSRSCSVSPPRPGSGAASDCGIRRAGVSSCAAAVSRSYERDHLRAPRADRDQS